MGVGVVTPPPAHSGGAVEPKEFPSPPERFESADRFFVFPPGRAPGPVRSTETAPVGRGELFLNEAHQIRVHKFRLRLRLRLGFPGFRGSESFVGSLDVVVPFAQFTYQLSGCLRLPWSPRDSLAPRPHQQ